MKSKIAECIRAVSFRLFGKIVPRFVAFEKVYHQSGFSLLYESYMTLMLLASSIVFVLTLVIGAIVHEFLFRFTMLQYVVGVLALSCASTLLVPIIFLAYPLLRRNQRKNEIDANLIYTTGYMGVLSAGGIPVERIFDRVVQVENRATIRDLAKRIIADIRVFGLDVASSLEEVGAHSPSETLTKLLVGIVNTMKTSGDLKSLLMYETKRLLSAKREQLKKTSATLVALAEVYVTAMVMGPIAFIIMLTILSVMGSTMAGLSPATQLNLLVFFGLPVLCTVFIVVLDGVLPREE